MKRNGKIEILRFIFCMSVVLYHIDSALWDRSKVLFGHITFFQHGITCVEFFFLVSGFLAAKSAHKMLNSNTSIGNDTFNFVFRKIKGLFLPHIIVVLITVVYMSTFTKNVPKYIADGLASVLFLDQTGISKSTFISVEWYIGAMLLALAIVYPLLRKSFDFVSMVVAPVGSVMLMGYLTKIHGFLGGDFWEGFTYANNIRALAVVLLGVFCYRMSEMLKTAELSKVKSGLLYTAENLCWFIFMLFIVSDVSAKYEAGIVLIMAFALTVTFSRDLSQSRLYNNKLVSYLGRLSLPVYLCQNLMRSIMIRNFDDMSNKPKVFIIVVGTVIIGIAIDFVCQMIRGYSAKRKKAASVA